MRGLKTQESKKFLEFHKLIQSTASKRGMVWFAFAGEGRDFETDEMEGEDMSGWLVPEALADEFEKEWLSETSKEHLAEFFLWLRWSRDDNGKISIEFMD